MMKWEYCRLYNVVMGNAGYFVQYGNQKKEKLTGLTGYTIDNAIPLLNILGESGWELVDIMVFGVVQHYFLKRPCSSAD